MAFDTRGVEVGQLWQIVRPDGYGLVIRVTGFTNHTGVYAEYLRVQFIIEKDGLIKSGEHKQAGVHGSVSIAAFSDGRYQQVKAIYNSMCHFTFYAPVSRTTSTTDSVAHPYPTALGEDDYIPTPIKQPLYLRPSADWSTRYQGCESGRFVPDWMKNGYPGPQWKEAEEKEKPLQQYYDFETFTEVLTRRAQLEKDVEAYVQKYIGIKLSFLDAYTNPNWRSSQSLLALKKLVLDYAAKIKTPKPGSGNDTGEV